MRTIVILAFALACLLVPKQLFGQTPEAQTGSDSTQGKALAASAQANRFVNCFGCHFTQAQGDSLLQQASQSESYALDSAQQYQGNVAVTTNYYVFRLTEYHTWRLLLVLADNGQGFQAFTNHPADPLLQGQAWHDLSWQVVSTTKP